MKNTHGYSYDAAEKPQPQLQASAPPPDSPMQLQRQQQYQANALYPTYAAQHQPLREPSVSALYAQSAHFNANVYHQQQPPPMAPFAPLAPLPPLAPLAPSAMHQSAAPYYHQQHELQLKHGAPLPVPPQVQFRDPYSDGDSDDDSSIQPVLIELGRLGIFHALNAVLGYVAFTVCVGGVVGSFVMLPLCCLGILVFRLVLYAVYGFAQLDVMLYNFISPPEDHVYVQVPVNPRSSTGERLSPTLSSFSPLSLMALIYFCSIKFLLSTLSTVCFSMAVASPLSLLCAVLGVGHGKVFQVALGPEDIADFKSDPLLFIIAALCLFAIGVALMHLVARASREATRFFCCERFSTYRYVHQHYDPRSQLYPASTTVASNTATMPVYGAIDTVGAVSALPVHGV